MIACAMGRRGAHIDVPRSQAADVYQKGRSNIYIAVRVCDVSSIGRARVKAKYLGKGIEEQLVAVGDFVEDVRREIFHELHARDELFRH